MYLIITTNDELAERAKLEGAAVFESTQVARPEVCFEAKEEFPKVATVEDIMVTLAIRPDLKGYDYIEYIIERCAKDPKYHRESMTKEIYPSCAKEFHTTASRVERAIRYAIEISFDKVPERYSKMFNRNLSKAPTNSEFISMMSALLARSSE